MTEIQPKTEEFLKENCFYSFCVARQISHIVDLKTSGLWFIHCRITVKLKGVLFTNAVDNLEETWNKSGFSWADLGLLLLNI